MIEKEKKFLNFIAYAPLIFVPIFVIIIIYLSYEIHIKSFKTNLSNIRENSLTIEKTKMKNKVLYISDVVIHKRSQTQSELKNRVKQRVFTAHSVAHALYKKYHKTKSKEEIKDIIKTALKQFQWNSGESYIWILDYNGIFQLAPSYLEKYNGKSVLKLKDNNGKQVIKDEIALCKEKGEGFLYDSFTRQKRDQSKHYKQIRFWSL